MSMTVYTELPFLYCPICRIFDTITPSYRITYKDSWVPDPYAPIDGIRTKSNSYWD